MHIPPWYWFRREDENYTETTGTLTCAPSDQTKAVTVRLLDDEKQEGSKSLTLAISGAESEKIVKGSATGTIARRELRNWLRTSNERRNVETAVTMLLAGEQE